MKRNYSHQHLYDDCVWKKLVKNLEGFPCYRCGQEGCYGGCLGR